MSTINTGGPAFPVHPEIRESEPHAGMTLRDRVALELFASFATTENGCTIDADAKAAFRAADVFIAYREVQP